jgi:hypothetical protein
MPHSLRALMLLADLELRLSGPFRALQLSEESLEVARRCGNERIALTSAAGSASALAMVGPASRCARACFA